MRTLKDALPHEFVSGEYSESPAYKFKDVGIHKIFRKTDSNWISWPGKHKNVHMWVHLVNGHAVGWNEGTRGWSFPVLGPAGMADIEFNN